MEMTGEQLIPATQQQTWEALNDPKMLKECVPGCESIDPAGENQYTVLMVARVGPVSAKFKGKLTLSDIKAPDSYSIAFEGQGGPAGFAKGGAQVRLSPENNQTRLAYDVKASVGGKLAQIGSRLVDAAAKKVADDFFRNFNEKVGAQHAAPAGGQGSGAHGAEEDEHHVAPVPRDPDLPDASDTTLRFFAAGALVVTGVALLSLFG
ncbi:MAG TPA: carbon monoxide dehydrogenase subunit G [Burkholderiales bacterium]|nr:carbon monoxide dehydrogenase subunit G [Burkholderiales bacterium]